MSISQKCRLLGKSILLSFLLWFYHRQKFQGKKEGRKERKGGREEKGRKNNSSFQIFVTSHCN